MDDRCRCGSRLEHSYESWTCAACGRSCCPACGEHERAAARCVACAQAGRALAGATP